MSPSTAAYLEPLQTMTAHSVTLRQLPDGVAAVEVAGWGTIGVIQRDGVLWRSTTLGRDAWHLLSSAAIARIVRDIQAFYGVKVETSEHHER